MYAIINTRRVREIIRGQDNFEHNNFSVNNNIKIFVIFSRVYFPGYFYFRRSRSRVSGGKKSSTERSRAIEMPRIFPRIASGNDALPRPWKLSTCCRDAHLYIYTSVLRFYGTRAHTWRKRHR